ncbi:MAG: hypothetical protein GXY52_03000 [Chloroflexi bacterium]|nr:hypothetical protein [Chloroflexota bacterium]
MSEIFDLLRKKVEGILGSINAAGGLRGTIEALRRQMAESDRKRAMVRAQAEVGRLNEQVNEMVHAVGLQVVSMQEAGTLNVPQFQPLCERITELKAAINTHEAELERLIAEEKAAELARQQAKEAAAAAAASEKQAPASPAAAPVSAASGMCRHCGSALQPGAAFCAFCATPVNDPSVPPSPASRFCANCGAVLRPRACFCAKCGTTV